MDAAAVAKQQETMDTLAKMIVNFGTTMNQNKDELKQDFKDNIGNLEANIDKRFESTDAAMANMAKEVDKLKSMYTNHQHMIDSLKVGTLNIADGMAVLGDDMSDCSGPTAKARKKPCVAWGSAPGSSLTNPCPEIGQKNQ